MREHLIYLILHHIYSVVLTDSLNYGYFCLRFVNFSVKLHPIVMKPMILFFILCLVCSIICFSPFVSFYFVGFCFCFWYCFKLMLFKKHCFKSLRSSNIYNGTLLWAAFFCFIIIQFICFSICSLCVRTLFSTSSFSSSTNRVSIVLTKEKHVNMIRCIGFGNLSKRREF